MATTALTTSETRRFSIWPPRPAWIGVTAIVTFVAAAGLKIGLPIWRQQVVIGEFDRLNVHCTTRPLGPAWLHDCLRHCHYDLDGLPQNVVSVEIGFNLYPSEFDPRWFASMPALEQLKMNASWHGPVDWSFLAGLTQLRELSLCGMQVSDDTLRYVSRHSQLESLDLSNAQVTDAGLAELAMLKRLNWLRLYNTQVTAPGIQMIRATLPEASVSWDFN